MSTHKRLDPILAVLCVILVACSLPFLDGTPTSTGGTPPPVLTPESFPVNPTAEIAVPPTPYVALSTPIAGLEQPLTLTSLKMFDALNGWAAATGDNDNAPHLLRTRDGGTTWQERTPAGMAAETGFSRFNHYLHHPGPQHRLGNAKQPVSLAGADQPDHLADGRRRCHLEPKRPTAGDRSVG